MEISNVTATVRATACSIRVKRIKSFRIADGFRSEYKIFPQLPKKKVPRKNAGREWKPFDGNYF